ncbi:MAG: hypothetical protein KDD14_07295 [Saprospiraceae bacterium]|nr:hypothetical protein [Saprospiraceae bacterium]
MKQLAREEAVLWKSVDGNLLKATSTSYDIATATLKDLQDLAEYKGDSQAFTARMKELRERYARSRALIRRFDGAGLF